MNRLLLSIFIALAVTVITLPACSGPDTSDPVVKGTELAESLSGVIDGKDMQAVSIPEFDALRDSDLTNISPENIARMIDVSASPENTFSTESVEGCEISTSGSTLLIYSCADLANANLYMQAVQSSMESNGYVYLENLAYDDVCTHYRNESNKTDIYILEKDTCVIVKSLLP
ncbi:hypothetical protein ACFLWO_02685 [Chloroflexota bacterium]